MNVLLDGNNNTSWSKITLTALGIAGAIPLGIYAGRTIIQKATYKILNTIITDEYHENMWDLISTIKTKTPSTIIETNLRAERREALHRPFSTHKQFVHFDGLMFNTAQLATLPTPDGIRPSLKTIIGKTSAKPMVLDMPVMIGGMAYGLALSKQAKIALARGSANAGIATNTGHGAFLQEERDQAKHLVIQYSRSDWNKDVKTLKKADMIEIQLGQGAQAGIGFTVPSRQLGKELKNDLGLNIKEDAHISSRLDNMQQGQELNHIVHKIKEVAPNIPISVKISAGKHIEDDLDIAIRAGANVIAIDGAQGGSFKSIPILQDGFGLPTVYALSRAVSYLKRIGKFNEVDLIIGGGIYTPEHMLKAIALGATAVYMGTIPLYAMSHKQGLKPLPFESPTQLIWDKGTRKKYFNVNKGAEYLSRYFKSTALELEEGVRALGKININEVTADDLMALDEQTAKITGVDLAYTP